MRPKEKAEELMDTIFKRTYHIKSEDAKQCALIAVEEVIKTYEELTPYHYISGYKTEEDFNENLKNINRQLETRRIQWLLYWQEVKTELEKR